MLWRKLIRDIWNNKGSYFACLVIVCIGLVAFTTFSIVTDNLSRALETFYREQNFAHGFVELVSMPESNVQRLARIEGIKDINGRLVKDVRVNTPPEEESVYLRLVSLDLSAPRVVNDARLLAGKELIPGSLAVWLDNEFFTANNLELGDSLEIIAGGRVREITIAGVAMSPEFTYYLPAEADLFPKPEQYGIAFLPLADMALVFPELEGRVNQVVFTLAEDARYEEVRDRLLPELEPYGLIRIYPRDDQLSHLMLTEEINGLKGIAKAFPFMFLSIAAVILYIMLKRLIEQQRGQIGILKALGYTNREIVLHYMSYPLAAGILGGLAGGLAGIGAAVPFTELLLLFFKVPEVPGVFPFSYFFQGLLIAVTIFLIAGYSGSRLALALNPAEAMRPPAPVLGKKFFLENLPFFHALLTMQGKMAVRNITRNPGRSAFLFLGIMLSCALVAVTWSFQDMVDKLAFYQYEEVEAYDARITLARPAASEPVVREVAGHRQVRWAEPLAEIPVSLTNRWREEDIVLIGLPRGSQLYKVLDEKGRKVPLPAEGIILSQRLAEKLAVTPGASIELASPYLRGEEKGVPVAVGGIIPQYLGMNAYMEISALSRLLGYEELATAVLVNVAGEEAIGILRDDYLESDLVAGVDSREERIRQAREMLEYFGIAVYFYVLIGVVIGFAIIYSSSFIVLSERSWELASLRVLGLTPQEVFSVITFEQWFISFFAILAGLPLGKAILHGLAAQLDTDMYSVPTTLTPDCLFAGVVITAFSIWAAQRFALRKVKELSLVEVLKTRE
ncbi:MAG TPA: FtsX-like permease family protein [Firmicutes bacterium]|nr:FtsX-like permease family protein [Bacillota bacterium]